MEEIVRNRLSRLGCRARSVNTTDIKARIAAEMAALLDKNERVSGIASFMKVDEDEAKRLIARGRRIARERVA